MVIGVKNLIAFFYFDEWHKLSLFLNKNDTVVPLLEYPENAQNPSLYTKIVNNVSTSYNILYEGKRIKQFGNSHYLYNDKGIRIAKIVYKYEGSTMIGYERHYYELEGCKNVNFGQNPKTGDRKFC